MASLSVKFQSISIHGPKKILGFASLLDKTPRGLRSIRYLFISNSTSQLSSVEDSPAPIQEPVLVAVFRILESVSNSLEVLELEINDPERSIIYQTPEGKITMPCLRELTIHAGCLFFYSMIVDYKYASSARRLDVPQLQRLYIEAATDMTSDKLFDRIRETALNLTHLRLSGVHWVHEGTLEFALGLARERADLSKGSLPMSIKVVFVEPASHAQIKRYGVPGRRYGAMFRQLHKFSTNCGLLVLFPPQRDGEEMDANADWMDRLNGLEGCWKGPKRH